MMMSFTPTVFSCSIRISSCGLPLIETIALGIVSVRGCSLVPLPAASMIACMLFGSLVCFINV